MSYKANRNMIKVSYDILLFIPVTSVTHEHWLRGSFPLNKIMSNKASNRITRIDDLQNYLNKNLIIFLTIIISIIKSLTDVTGINSRISQPTFIVFLFALLVVI